MSEEKKQVRREEPRRVTAAARLTPVAARQRRGKAARRVRYAAIDYLATSRRNWKVNFARLFTLVRNLIAYPHTPSNLSAHRPLFLSILLSLSLPAPLPSTRGLSLSLNRHVLRTNTRTRRRSNGDVGSQVVASCPSSLRLAASGLPVDRLSRLIDRWYEYELYLSLYIYLLSKENTFVNICIIILGSKSLVIRISNRLLEMFSNNSCWFNYFFFF